jgi:6-phosphofructokinase 1
VHTAILIPEQPRSVAQICEWINSVREAPDIVVAEGFVLAGMTEAHPHKGLDALWRPRLGGTAEILAPTVEDRTGIEYRATALGSRTAKVDSDYDCVLATRLGRAVDLAM